MQFYLPGVFEQNPNKQVNASLWTVPFELECYIGLSILFVVRVFRRVELMIAATVVLSVYWFFRDTPFTWEQRLLVPGRVLLLSFLAGATVFKLRDRLRGGLAVAVAALAFTYLLLAGARLTYLLPLPVPYASATLGCLQLKRPPIILYGY